MCRVIWCRRPPGTQMRLDIGQHRPHGVLGRGVRRCAAKDHAVGSAQQISRLVIGRSADHHAVKARVQKTLCLLQRGDAAIDRQMQRGNSSFICMDQT